MRKLKLGKKYSCLSLLIAATLILTTVNVVSSTSLSLSADEPQYVIIITIDGCRPDTLQDANTPNIDEIVEGAAYSWTAQTVSPYRTPQGHASLLTGASPNVHDFDSPGDEVEAETIFQVFERTGYKTAFITGKGDPNPTQGRIYGLEENVSYVKNDVDYRSLGDVNYNPGSEDPNGNIRVMENAIQIFVENQPTLMFVLLPMTDYIGHIYGHTSSEYSQAIEKADQAIGMLVDNLVELGIYENTLLVITADHGMVGTSHTGKSGAKPIPLVMQGPGVTVGDLGEVSIIDVAPTVTALFGLRAPGEAEGINLFEIQEEVDEGALPTTAILAAAVVVVAIVIVGAFLFRRK